MLSRMRASAEPLMHRRVSHRLLPVAVAAALAMGIRGAAAEPHVQPDQALAVLLQQLKAKPLGSYDGMRLLRIQEPGGGSLTISVSCERQLWRVLSSQPLQGRATFYGDSPFLSAAGIQRTWVCSAPARALE